MRQSIRRKLFLSLFSVLLTFSSLVVSTYAWFSMNQSVGVTGISLTVESNSIYLIIGSENNINTVQTAGLMDLDFGMTSAQSKVFPSAHETLANATAANTPANWYYQVGDAPTASTSTKAKNYLTAENFGRYVIHKVCYITVTVGSNPAENLVVSSVTITSNNTATGQDPTLEPVKIVVASSTAVVELDSEHTSSNTVLVSSITDQTLVAIDIFLYYDGSHASVYTNNTANLDGADIDIEFSVD